VRRYGRAMRVPVLLSSALLGWSAVANLIIGDRAYVSRNLALAVLLLAVGRRAGASARDLGVERRRLTAGLRWGAAAAGVVAVAVGGAVALADVVPGIATLLADERAVATESALMYATLVRIPLGTALFEEIAFRGVLLGLLLRVTSTGWAVAASSVVFGLWHIPPTLVTLEVNGVAGASIEGIAAMVGAVVVTTVAGTCFCWLRLRSGSLLAPVLAHWSTNALGLRAAALTEGSAR
jgi:uncharacterized protein